ncbi:hypothetical protein FACS1894192_08230 [Bacilli bacterium]|nr:hypothetical protein FACS1894192_08230 [Bacilli bacterium]
MKKNNKATFLIRNIPENTFKKLQFIAEENNYPSMNQFLVEQLEEISRVKVLSIFEGELGKYFKELNDELSKISVKLNEMEIEKVDEIKSLKGIEDVLSKLLLFNQFADEDYEAEK